MITDEQLAEWERLAGEATEGPWFATQPYTDADYGAEVCDVETEPDGAELAEYCLPRDAPFIAASRTAVPALIDEVRRLRLELATRAVFAPDGKPSCCPVCGGRGLVPPYFYEQNALTLTVGDITCRCCAGAGYIR